MATPRKLPSGRWNVQVYSHRDENGKPHFKSITADSKRECILLEAKYRNMRERTHRHDLTVSEAIELYISSKESVLAPSTIKAYRSMARSDYAPIGAVRAANLTPQTIQKWISQFSVGHSPKTTANVYGLLTSSLRFICAETPSNIRLPKRMIYEATIPSDDEVKTIISYFEGMSDPDMANAVRLAAYGTFRRSEICGLRKDDIDRKRNTIHIHRVEIIDSSNKVVLKEVPKTSSSDRYVPMPKNIIMQIPDREKPIDLNPTQVSHRFTNALAELNIPNVRFHDLRHYAASFMHAIGIPDAYIMERGGWETDSTLKRIYRGTMDDYKEKYTEELFTKMGEI